MPKAYSLDLRERVVGLVEDGHSRRAVAAHFEVSVSFVVKLMSAFRATGSLDPKPSGGRRHAKLEPHRSFLLAQGGRESRLHHAGTGGRTGRRDRREGRSRFPVALAHSRRLSFQKRMARPVREGVCAEISG
jgi:hypothetical protein